MKLLLINNFTTLDYIGIKISHNTTFSDGTFSFLNVLQYSIVCCVNFHNLKLRF